MSANGFVSTASTDMAARPSTSFQRFSAYSSARDNTHLLFGDDGDVAALFNTTRNCLVIDGQGPAVEVRGLNMAPDRYELVERFQKAPKLNADVLSATEATNEICNRDFEILGTNAVSTCTALYAEGGMVMTTTTAANDQVICLPHLDTSESAWNVTTWGTDQLTRWEAVVQPDATITSIRIWAGLKLTNTSVIATDAEQAFFVFDTGAGSEATLWHTVYSIGGVDIEDGVGSAFAASTTYHLVIDIDSSRIARFYINGTLMTTSTALTTTTDLIPYIGVQTLTTAARALRVFKTCISRKAGA